MDNLTAPSFEKNPSLPPFSDRTNDGRVPFRLRGKDLQALEFDMLPGDKIYAQPGSFISAVGGIKLDVEWGKSLLDPFRRMWSGEKATLQEIVCDGAPGRVVVGAAMVGRIVHIPLDGTRAIFCDRGAYLAHTGDIEISIGITKKIRTGLFGGNGFIMQRISGYGDVFLHALGSVIPMRLKSNGEAIVNTRNLLAFDDSVSYDITLSGGPFTMWFGGQGIFLAKLKGPGRVIAHSIDHHAFVKYLKLPNKKGTSEAPPSDNKK